MKLGISIVAILMLSTSFAMGQNGVLSKSDSVVLKGYTLLKKAKEKSLSETFNKININPYGVGGLSNVFTNFSVSTKVKAGSEGKFELKSASEDKSRILGATITQTIAKDEDEATLFNFLDGFGSGTKLGFNFQQKVYFGRIMKQDVLQKFKKDKADYVKKNNLTSDLGVSFIEVYGKDAVVPTRTSVAFNVDIALTRSSYKYTLDPISLKEQEDTYFRPSIDLSLGLLLSNTSSFLASYSYSETLKSADKVNFIIPLASTPSVMTSKELAFGAPEQILEHKVSVGWKKTLGSQFALAPTFKYGTKTETKAFDLPVYFIKEVDDEGKPKSLTGGIRLGYISEGSKWEKFSKGLFLQLMVTAPISIE